MAGISKRVLARRQKDLEGFTEYYQGRLDKLAAEKAKSLAPAWQRMTKQIEKQVADLYFKVGAMDDPTKITALNYKGARLEALAKQLEKDLQLGGIIKSETEKMVPVFTDAISAGFEDGYYFQAWGLEQAAKVGVNVPLLSKANVLGVIVNPWLPDGANYSSRIRANADFIAKKAREKVAEAVKNGWSVNEAARAMRDVTGEGYFRNVALMRTELNRAAALGSSYLGMENADICDAKRWNATLDIRTAPKDRDNDGKQYDLDYDTPGNPGVAGQRIPNHTNCRCKWTLVLSALGVSTKERIARSGDTKDSWGENVYTKARTYDEYAEKRGLPPAKELLERDNFKSYLRPGETMEAFNRKVTRWQTAGGAVTTARPAWDKVNKTELKAAAEGKTGDEWDEIIKAKVAQGVENEADVREVGAILRKQVEAEDKALKAARDKLDLERDELEELMAEAQLKAMGGTDKAAVKRYEELKEQLTEKIKAVDEINDKLATKRGERLKEMLAKVRQVGPAGTEQPYIKRSSVPYKKEIDNVREYLPTDWVKASNTRPMKVKKGQRGYYQEAKFKDEEALSRAGYSLRQLERAKRMDLYEDTIALSGRGSSLKRTAFHEMGHRMEDMIPNIRRLEHEFYQRRTAGDELKWLGGGYSRSETARFDKFLRKYMGKDYGNKPDSYYELLSMGLEGIYTGSVNVLDDTDYADFIYGLLASQ
jgi:SPP1 gp7 family putative phage head morphogenesis protein